MKRAILTAAVVVLGIVACTKEPVLEIGTQSSFEASWEGGTFTVEVTCNNDWAVTPDKSADWCAISAESGNGDAEITFTVSANEGNEDRSVTYTIASKDLTKTISITQGTYEVPEDAVNLSEKGTANSYIVAPGSKSAFSVEFKGNSTSEKVGAVVGSKLVWQSVKGLVKNIKFAPKSSSFVAEFGNEPGNAVVAAIDKDGTILWSWHLWVVDYQPEESLYETPANASGTVWTFMDRNLGAVSTERGTFDKNGGLIYQWGRKDPFPSAVGFTSQNEDYTYIEDGEPVLYDIDGNELPKISSKAAFEGSISKGIANPDVFYKVGYKETGEKDEYGDPVRVQVPKTSDWSDTSDDDAWGGVSQKKSIYDPCPVGYKVPVCDADGNTPYAWMIYKQMNWDTANRGAEQNGQWFPTIGTRVAQSGGLDYGEAHPYSGMWIGTAGKASSNLEQYPTLYGQYMFIINGKRTYKVNKDVRSQGMNLRCVAE